MTFRLPITIRGVTYPSRTAAALALGIRPQSISGALRRGTLDHAGLGHRPRGPSRAQKPAKLPWKVPCIVNGQHFPSIAAAARAFNVAHGTVSAALEHNRADRVGISKRNSHD